MRFDVGKAITTTMQEQKFIDEQLNLFGAVHIVIGSLTSTGFRYRSVKRPHKPRH